jgi:hypothetical protein
LRAIAPDQQGGIVMMFAMFAIILCGFAALAVDAGNLYVTKTRLQGAADAAALAAVQELPNEGQTRAAAIQYAETNLPPDRHGDVLAGSDVEIGTWDADSRTFTPGGTAPDAVRVTLRRAADLPDGFEVRAGETAIISEVYFDFAPFLSEMIVEPQTIYRSAMNRPRLGTLDQIEAG